MKNYKKNKSCLDCRWSVGFVPGPLWCIRDLLPADGNLDRKVSEVEFMASPQVSAAAVCDDWEKRTRLQGK